MRAREQHGDAEAVVGDELEFVPCVVLDHKGEALALDNDTVIVCAGGILPTAMLQAMGVEVETKYGSP